MSLMFRTRFAAIALASLSALTLGTAQAADGTPRVDQRQAHQEQRIRQGVASGELTARETARLARQQRHIAHAEKHAKADGNVTQRERRHLHAMQAHASRDIRRQKHDRQQQPR